MKKSRVQAVPALLLLLVTGGALAQTCVSSIPDSAPDSRYQMSANGTVVDLQTGLMWMRCALGQSWDAKQNTCTGTANTYSWQGALVAVQTLDQGGGYAGFTDWRLPNYRALTSITRYRCHAPAINLTAFPATPPMEFWTSTPVASGVGFGWTVNFETGQAIYENYANDFPIRLVRAGAFAP